MTRRLLLAFLALTLTVLITFVVPLGLTFQDRIERELASGLERDAFTIAAVAEETVEHPGDPTNLVTPDDVRRLTTEYTERTGGRVVVVDASGRALADSDPSAETDRNFASRSEISDALAGRVSSGTRYSSTLGTDLFYVAVPIASGQVYGAVRITYSGDQIETRIRAYWRTLAVITVVSLLAATALGVTLARWVARPLKVLGDVATGFGRGDLARRAPTDGGPPEVRQLAAAFNRTAARLEELVTAQDQFVADASHQLRTPLTALRLRLENLEQAWVEQQGLLTEIGADDPQVRSDLDAALDETTRLSRLVDELLLLARAERADAGASVERVELGAMLAERAAAFAPMAGVRSVAVVAEPGPVLHALATPDRLSQVLDNLIANALDASPPGSTVRLSAEDPPDAVPADGAPERPPGVLVHVRDRGRGLTAEQRTSAFARFWRDGTASRATSAPPLGGSGLGLAIVAKLVRADGGEVWLEENPEGGTDAVVRLRRV